MVAPISVSNPQKRTNVSFFTTNDIHAQVVKLERIKTASDAFDKFVPQQKTDKLKFSSGDIALGEDKGLNKVAYEFENSIGVKAATLGNHEFDIDVKSLADLIKGAKFDVLALNIGVKDDSPLKNKIKKSEIIEQNGNKYGVIGLAPFDMFTRLKDKSKQNDFQVKDLQTTKKELQAE